MLHVKQGLYFKLNVLWKYLGATFFPPAIAVVFFSSVGGCVFYHAVCQWIMTKANSQFVFSC